MAKPQAKPETAQSGETLLATQSTAVAETGPAAPALKFKIAKRITMPTFNPGVNVPYFIRADSEFRVSTYVDPDPKKASEKPATICEATNMETGEVVLWLVPEVVKKNLEEAYPDGGYNGRIFACQKLPKRPGKRYFDFQIAEVELDD